MSTIKDEIIKRAVDKFLGMELPDFHPDGGISFNRIPNHRAVGTNLFSAQEATDILNHIIGDELDNLIAKHGITNL